MIASRVHNKLPVAREGIPFIGAGCLLTLLVYGAGFFLAAVFLGLLSLFMAFFFRDPHRSANAGPDGILAPADGKILSILTLDDDGNPLGAPARKISIFMSLFDVHVNRMPTGGRVTNIHYRSGRFFSADRDKASIHNEQNRIDLDTDDSRRIVVIQIAGLVARRIACWVQKGDKVSVGQRFGLIRFGSRLEVFLPLDATISSEPGQRVYAGRSVIARLSSH